MHATRYSLGKLLGLQQCLPAVVRATPSILTTVRPAFLELHPVRVVSDDALEPVIIVGSTDGEHVRPIRLLSVKHVVFGE
jgi:hypothetical protein